ncbi:MAG TPA: tetratricopeptide repeat protein [Phycisphaerales bacterium]|nr:tetratricopeptide repeat protein [Phycisphaerales bacterium]
MGQRPDRSARWHGCARWAGTLVLALALSGPEAAAVQNGTVAAPAAAFPAATPDALIALLDDPAAPPADRERAAALLVERCAEAETLRIVTEALARADDAAGSRRLLLTAMARAPSVAVDLGAPLGVLASASPAEQVPAVLGALASVRTREAARTIVAFVEPSHPAAVRTAAFDALERLAARTDLPRTAEAWQAWVTRVETLPERLWQRELIESLARRSADLWQRNERAKTRLVETTRRLYLLVTAEERLTMLASLLRDDRDELRRLGFELAARELSATNTLGGEVAAAAISLLEHAGADVRAEAALLVSRLAPPEAEPVVGRALARETDARAAEALLVAATRWPSPVIRGPALAWLGRESGARGAAADALLALHRAGLLDDPTDRQRVVEALKAAPVDALNASSVRLLAALGDDDDRRTVASLLGSTRGGVRSAAADSLAPFAEFTSAITARAADDPSLFAAACRAVQAHLPAVEAFERMVLLPAPTPAAHAAALDAFVETLAPADRVAVARVARSPARRELALAPLIEGAKARHLDESDRVEAILLLAEARLALGRAETALAVLDVLPEATDDATHARAVRARLDALIALRRFDDAAALVADADAWLDALDRAATLPHAAEAADAFERPPEDREDEEQAGPARRPARGAPGGGRGRTNRR